MTTAPHPDRESELRARIDELYGTALALKLKLDDAEARSRPAPRKNGNGK